MHQPAQIVGLCVSLAHVGLLAGFYISVGGTPSDIFVSAILDSLPYFKALLTIVVVLDIAVAAAYIFLSHPRLILVPYGILAGLALLTALASWITVVSTKMGDPWHFRGTAIFVIASSVYSCFLVALAPRFRCLYATLLLSILGCAAAFVTVHLRQDYGTSSDLEWVTFLLQGTMLVIYYYETPIQQASAGANPADAAEAASPLLPVAHWR